MRLIDADALMQEYARFVAPSNNSDFTDVPTWNDAVSLLGSAPTIEERKTGRWIQQDHNKKHGNVTTCIYYYPVCSECGHTGNFGMNFCPNCGSPMEVEHDSV